MKRAQQSHPLVSLANRPCWVAQIILVFVLAGSTLSREVTLCSPDYHSACDVWVHSPQEGETYAPDSVFLALESFSDHPGEFQLRVRVDEGDDLQLDLQASGTCTAGSEGGARATVRHLDKLPTLAAGDHFIELLLGERPLGTIRFRVGTAPGRQAPYSSHNCTTAAGLDGESCLLRHVCMKAVGDSDAQVELAYFQDPAAVPFVQHPNRLTPLDLDPAPQPGTTAVHLRLRTSSVEADSAAEWKHGLSLLFSAHTTEQHPLLVSALPIFTVLKVHAVDDGELRQPKLLSLQRAVAHHDLINALGSKMPVLTSVAGVVAGGVTVCFERLVLGHTAAQRDGPVDPYRHHASAKTWWGFRSSVLANLAITEHPPPSQQNCNIALSLLPSSDAHGITNPAELADALRQRFAHCEFVDVASLKDLRTQLAAVATASVMLASTGYSSSLLAPFLAFGSVLIEFGMYMGPRSAYFMHDYMLSAVEYIQVVFYEPNAAEAGKAASSQKYMGANESAPLQINKPRVLRSVKRALSWASEFHAAAPMNDWQPTEWFKFNRPGYVKCCVMHNRQDPPPLLKVLRSGWADGSCYQQCWPETS